jgi:hypothetical protein
MESQKDKDEGKEIIKKMIEQLEKLRTDIKNSKKEEDIEKNKVWELRNAYFGSQSDLGKLQEKFDEFNKQWKCKYEELKKQYDLVEKYNKQWKNKYEDLNDDNNLLENDYSELKFKYLRLKEQNKVLNDEKKKREKEDARAIYYYLDYSKQPSKRQSSANETDYDSDSSDCESIFGRGNTPLKKRSSRKSSKKSSSKKTEEVESDYD